MRSTWTDSRLDDFAAETGRRFDSLERHVDDGVRDLRGEIRGVRDELRDEVHGVRDELRTEVHGVRDLVIGVHSEVLGVYQVINSLHRTIIITGGGMIAALVGVIATQL